MDQKKIKGIILLLASLLLLLLWAGFSFGSARLEKCIMSAEDFDGISGGREDMNFSDLMVQFDGNVCFKEKESDRIFYSLIEDSKSAFNPTVKVSDKGGKLRLAIKEKGFSQEGIEKNEPLEAIIYNDKYFHKYNLIATTLPIMNLDCKNEINEEDSKMKMTLYDNRKATSSRVLVSDGFVRFRGATTLYYPKKGLRLSLTQKSVGENRRPNDLSILGLRQDDDWILYAAYNDQEKVRNVFSHNLWEYTCAKDNKNHIDAGMEYKYLELFVDGKYQGLYAIGSPLDEKQFELSGDIKKNALYKSVYWSNIDGIMMPENTVTGFETKSGDDLAAWSLFLDYSFYLEKNRKDSQKLLAGIDIDNAIDLYLFFAMIQGMDTTHGYDAKNYYFSVSKEGDIPKALYAPWDMDISWGNFWLGDLDVNFTIPYGIEADENFLFEQGYLNQIIVNNDTDIATKMFDKYYKLRKEGWSEENIDKLIDEYEADIYGSGAFLRDMQRWPEGTYNNPSEKLTTFRDYVHRRLLETDLYMERLKTDFDKSVLVRRATQYKDLKEKNFIIVLKDPSYLEDKDYTDLFSYIGIDMDAVYKKCYIDDKGEIADYPRVILYNGQKKETQTLCMFPKTFDEALVRGLIEPEDAFYFDSNRYVYKSVIGKITLERKEDGIYFSDSDFGVYVDDIPVYATVAEYEPDIRFYFLDDGEAQTMELVKDYKLDVMLNTFNDLKLYLKALDMFDLDVRVECKKPADFLEDKEIEALVDKLGERLIIEENDDVDGINLIVTGKVNGSNSGSTYRIDNVFFTYEMKDTGFGKDLLVTSCTR